MKTSTKTRRASSTVAHRPSPTLLAMALMLACTTPTFAQQINDPQGTVPQTCQASATPADGADATTDAETCTSPQTTGSTAPLTVAPMAGIGTLADDTERTGNYISVDGLFGSVVPATTEGIEQGAIAIGAGANANGSSVAIGTGAASTGRTYSRTGVAIGASAASNQDGTAVGSNAKARGIQSTVVGFNATANGNYAVALGDRTTANFYGAVAIGSSADAGAYATSMGISSNAGAIYALALGYDAEAAAGAENAVALGARSIADVPNTVSVGSSSMKRQIMHVAAGTRATDAVNLAQLQAATGSGLVTYDDATGVVSVAAGQAGTTVDFGGTAGARVLTNVAAGALNSNSTDAVNGAQLSATNDRVAVNEGDISNLDGRVTVNEGDISNLDSRVTVNEGDITNLDGRVTVNEGDITNLDSRVTVNEGDITSIYNQIDGLTSGAAGLVTYDDTTGVVSVAATQAGSTVDFGGIAGARVLTNVAAGALNATSTDAVNGAQLSATNDRVAVNEGDISNLDGRVTVNEGDITNLDSRVTTNEGDITTINQQIGDLTSGAAGLVTYDDDAGVVSVAAGKGGSIVDFAGSAGARVLTNVAAGALSATSTDAVNGAQLSATNDRVATNEGDITNLDGRVTVNEGDISNLDERVTVNEGDINTINTQLGDVISGSAGLVTYDDATGVVSVAAAKGGTVVNMQGTDGLRRLTGIADGVDAQDAVTMNQLRAVGMIDPGTGQLLNTLTYDDSSLARATLGGAEGTVVDNVADGRVEGGSREAINGGQLAGALDGISQQFNDYRSWVEQTFIDHIAEGGDTNAGGASNGGGDGYDADNGSIAIGDGAGAGAGSIEIGEGASADGTDQVAIGHDAKASADNAVAIGAGSTADRADSVAVGSAGHERVITHVADGVLPTDAVNMRQLEDRFESVRSYTEQRMHQVDQRIDRMGALSGAYAGMALNTAGLKGHNRVGVGFGSQNGREAMAVGYQRILGKRDNISVSLGGAFSGSETSVSAGAGFSW